MVPTPAPIDDPVASLPPGHPVDLGERGTTWVRELPGPPGAATVLLLHGWSVTADLNWFTSYAALAERYHVIAMDHRGHGRGIRPPGGAVRLEDCADDAAALLGALGVAQAIVVGYSMGGPIAQLVWRRHPEVVAGLVLCATARHFQGGPLSALWYRSYGGLGRLAAATPSRAGATMRRLADRKVAGSGRADWMRTELYRSDPAGVLTAMASLGRFRSNRWIGQVDVPTAVVVTGKDRTVLAGRQRALARAVPGATVHEVDGGHDVCVTDPPRFLPAFLEACDSVVGRLHGEPEDRVAR